MTEKIASLPVDALEPPDWFKRFAYVAGNDSYFDVVTRDEYSRKAFDAMYRGAPTFSIHNKKKIPASYFFDENRQALGSHILVSYTFAAGEWALCEMSGKPYANRWRDARPNGVPGDASPWLEHLERMVPVAAEREHVLDCLAFKRQNPHRKINHAILHAGSPGAGKDTLYAPFLYSIGGVGLQNVAVARAEEVTGDFGYVLESEIIILNEMRAKGQYDARVMENALKPVIAAPPEILLVNKKHQAPTYIQNRGFVIAMSNFRAAISIPADDRRWFVLWSDAGKLPEAEATRLWGWYQNGGYAVVTHYLATRDVSAFNPAAPPPMTAAKESMIDLSLTGAEVFVQQCVRDRRGPFARGIVGSPVMEVHKAVLAMVQGGNLRRETIVDALAMHGWVHLRRLTSARHTSPKDLWVVPELAGLSRSQLRDLLEGDSVPTLTVVNRTETPG